MIYGNGDVYSGQWSLGKANGFGVFTNYAVDDEKNGPKPIEIVPSFKGHWVDDHRTGQGKEKLSDGSVFEGTYLRGYMHGYG